MTHLNAGALEALPTDEGTRFSVGDTEVAVFRVGDAAYAIADRCSHAEASLSEGVVFGTEVECPRHGAAFDIVTGEALTLPATQPVTTHNTEIVDGEVLITINPKDAE